MALLPVLAFIGIAELIRGGVKKIFNLSLTDAGHLSEHIDGAVEVPLAMYPHAATILIDLSMLCGGSIISDKHILTAGQCTVSKENVPYKPDAYRVYLGSGSPIDAVEYEVCKVWTHEAFVPQKRDNDIAVLMLCKEIKFGPKIRKVEIAPDDSWKKEKYTLTITSFAFLGSSRDYSRDLIAGHMRFLDSGTCNQSYASDSLTVPDHMFCMIGQRWTNVCFGDYGSGVIWKRYLVGLVSTPHDFCLKDGHPSLYTDVSDFRPWILSKIKEANSTKSQAQTGSKNSRMLRQLFRNMQVDLV